MTTPTKKLDLNLFFVFYALLQHGNVSRAASALGRSQSAVSHALARLRDHFGDELFIKTHDGVIATERALALSASVESLIRAADDAEQKAIFNPATSTRRITLCLSDMAELTVVPALLPLLRRHAPGCTLHTVADWGERLEAMLESGDVDIAISGPLKMSANMQQQKLFEHSYIVLAGRDCPIETTIDAEGMARIEHIAIQPTLSDRYTLDAALERQGITRKVALTTPHYLSVPLLLERCPAYAAIVPLHLAEAFGLRGGLKLLRPDFELPTIDITHYWHRRVQADTFSIWLRGLVRTALLGASASPVHETYEEFHRRRASLAN